MARLTPAGKKMLTHIRQRAESQVTRTLAPLTAAERAQLAAALSVLRRVLVVAGDETCALTARDLT
jgi:DNA-binding MarR family transcriptional regulator